MNKATNTHNMHAPACKMREFPDYRALQDAIRRAIQSRRDAAHAEAWAEALRLNDAGLKDEQRMRDYLDQLPQT